MKFGFAASLLMMANHVNGEVPPKGTVAYESYRARNCEPFVFEAKFDSYPSEFGIELKNVIDGEVIWHKEDHKYYPSDAFQIATDSVCILPDECWRVTITDSEAFQDGLTKTEGDDTTPGAFTLKFGDRVVAQYDGAAANACYMEKWYEFGQGCQTNALTEGTSGGLCGEANEEIAAAPCTNFNFLINLDEFPEDVRYVLEGPKGIIWDKAPWDQTDVGRESTVSTCLSPDGCYVFTVYDSEKHPHGLTDAPEGGRPGSFMAWFGDELVGAYFGDIDGCYAAKWFKFGNGCPANGKPMQGTVREGCNSGVTQESCDAFHFFLRADEFPEDIKFSLTNSKGEMMLKEGPWTQKHQGMEFEHEACLLPSECYTFVISDSDTFQDGLTEAPAGGLPGEFVIKYNNEIIGSYNGGTDGCYASKGYRFGSTCPFDQLTSDTVGGCGDDKADISEQSAIETECAEFHFFARADEFPEDIRYLLNNTDGDMIWEDRPWTQKDQNKELNEYTCLNPDDCYTFVIFDSERYQDGLTNAPSTGKAGAFQLKFADEIIGSYDGSTDGCYGSKWFRFGNACPSEEAVEFGTTGDCSTSEEETEIVEEPQQVDCTGLKFIITTDEFPEDVLVGLEDSQGNKLWDERPWNQLDIGKEFGMYICLDPIDCYTFTIEDKYHDGLTKRPSVKTNPNGLGDPGKFELRFGNDILATYNAADDGCYESKTYIFGGQCTTTELSFPPDGSCPSTRRRGR